MRIFICFELKQLKLIHWFFSELSLLGVVIVILGIETATGRVVSGPDIVSNGFVFEDASQDLLAEVRDVVMDTLTFMIPMPNCSTTG
jgi:hypothetical protein